MGGRDSCRDLRPYSRYRALFVDDELTPGVLPRSHHPRHCRVRVVLDLDPILRSAALIRPIAAFRDQSLQAEFASNKHGLVQCMSPELAHRVIWCKAALRSLSERSGH
jgi:hypothetical protein